MKEFIKNKFVTIIIASATVVLAGIAIFTAVRLYQLRQDSVAPTAPESVPAAVIPTQEPTEAPSGLDVAEIPEACSQKQFNISTPTPTPTTPPDEPSCNDNCVGNSDCPSDQICSDGRCRNPSCTSESDCVCPRECNSPCGSNNDCESDKVCSNGLCRHPDCLNDSDCVCDISQPTPAPTTPPTAAPRATDEPALPGAGVATPTLVGLSAGILLLIISFALAL